MFMDVLKKVMLTALNLVFCIQYTSLEAMIICYKKAINIRALKKQGDET